LALTNVACHCDRRASCCQHNASSPPPTKQDRVFLSTTASSSTTAPTHHTATHAQFESGVMTSLPTAAPMQSTAEQRQSTSGATAPLEQTHSATLQEQDSPKPQLSLTSSKAQHSTKMIRALQSVRRTTATLQVTRPSSQSLVAFPSLSHRTMPPPNKAPRSSSLQSFSPNKTSLSIRTRAFTLAISSSLGSPNHLSTRTT
jgi:hypothetical protein